MHYIIAEDQAEANTLKGETALALDETLYAKASQEGTHR